VAFLKLHDVENKKTEQHGGQQLGGIVYPSHKNPSGMGMKKIRKKDPIDILEQGNAVHEGIEAVKKIKSFFVLKELDQKENKKVEKHGHHKKTKSILVAFFEEIDQRVSHLLLAHTI
jgi:hypothetical protein